MWQSTVFPGHLTSSWWLFWDKTTIDVEGHTSFLAQWLHQESSAAVMAHALLQLPAWCSCSSSSIHFPQLITPSGSAALSIQLPQPLPEQHVPVPHCPLHKETPLKNQPHSPGAPGFEQHDEQVHMGCISHSHGHVTLCLLSKLKSLHPDPWFAALFRGQRFILSEQPKPHLRTSLSFVPKDFSAPAQSQETLYFPKVLEPLFHLPNMQICDMDGQSLHPFEQGSIQLSRKKICPLSGQNTSSGSGRSDTHFVPAEGYNGWWRITLAVPLYEIIWHSWY